MSESFDPATWPSTCSLGTLIPHDVCHGINTNGVDSSYFEERCLHEFSNIGFKRTGSLSRRPRMTSVIASSQTA